MWKLTLEELRYNLYHLVPSIFLVLLILIFPSWQAESLSPNLLLYLVVFITLNNLHSFQMKENRVRLQCSLGAGIKQVAFARVMTLLLPAYFSYGLYATFHILLFTALDWRGLLLSLGFVLIAISFFVAIRDISFLSARLIQVLDYQKVILGLTVLMGFFALLGLLAFLSVSSGRNQLHQVITFFETNNPFTGMGGNLVFLLMAHSIFALTILTFVKRKFYTN